MKPQIVLIHGGMTFDTYEEYWQWLEKAELTLERINKVDWKDNLQAALPDHEVIYPKMPNSKNARYSEWKLWFEKLTPLLRDDVILVGHSLGGIFLAKYLAENNFSLVIKQLHLVAPPYDTEFCEESLADFALTNHLENVPTQASKIFLYQSKDDPAVPYQDVLKYQRDLPTAELTEFIDRGHFIQAEFPELVANIDKNS